MLVSSDSVTLTGAVSEDVTCWLLLFPKIEVHWHYQKICIDHHVGSGAYTNHHSKGMVQHSYCKWKYSTHLG